MFLLTDGTSVLITCIFDTAHLYYQINIDKDKRLTSAASFKFASGFEKAQITRYEWCTDGGQYFNLHPDLALYKRQQNKCTFFLLLPWIKPKH